MTATSVNRPSRKELVALGTAITFAYVGAYISFRLAWHATVDHRFEVFWWISGVCWFLAPALLARLGYRLARRRGWGGVIGATVAVIPWLVITGLAILYVVRLASCLEGC